MNTEDKTYNGWANYETWLVNLWLNNDEGIYNATRKRVSELLDGWELPEFKASIGITEEQGKRYDVGEDLKDYVENLCLDELKTPASMVADLVTSALSEVEWHDIADAWIEVEVDA